MSEAGRLLLCVGDVIQTERLGMPMVVMETHPDLQIASFMNVDREGWELGLPGTFREPAEYAGSLSLATIAEGWARTWRTSDAAASLRQLRQAATAGSIYVPMPETSFRSDRLIEAGHKYKDYRPVVVPIIRDRHGRWLFVESAKASGEWSFVQGGIDEGEDLRSAGVREIGEEVGIVPEELELGELTEVVDIDAPIGRVDKRGFSKGKRYFMIEVAYSGNGDLHIKTDELSAYQWLAKDEARALIADKRPEKRELIERALTVL